MDSGNDGKRHPQRCPNGVLKVFDYFPCRDPSSRRVARRRIRNGKIDHCPCVEESKKRAVTEQDVRSTPAEKIFGRADEMTTARTSAEPDKVVSNI
jgi:hypothetical protein